MGGHRNSELEAEQLSMMRQQRQELDKMRTREGQDRARMEQGRIAAMRGRFGAVGETDIITPSRSPTQAAAPRDLNQIMVEKFQRMTGNRFRSIFE
jgi:hypothetical protein